MRPRRATFAGWARGNWTIVPLSVLVQGRTVHAFVVPGELCASADWPNSIPMVSFPPLTPRWFRFE